MTHPDGHIHPHLPGLLKGGRASDPLLPLPSMDTRGKSRQGRLRLLLEVGQATPTSHPSYSALTPQERDISPNLLYVPRKKVFRMERNEGRTEVHRTLLKTT
jgi:hypothetical protein